MTEQYWKTTFGFGNFDEFRSETDAFMPSLRFYGIGWDRDQIARYVWFNPGSGLAGGVAATLLARRTFGWGDEESKTVAQRHAEAQLDGGAVPMAPLVVPGVIRVAIKAASGGQSVVNVVGVRKTGSGGATEAAQAVKAAWEGTGKPTSVLIPAYALQEYEATDLSSVDGEIATISSGTAGTGTGNKSANSTCALVKWNGGSRSRSTRGRLYLGPMTEANIADDGRTLSAAAVTAISAAMGQFRTALSNAGFPLVVVSVKNASAFDVASHSVESIIATQRRRVR